MKYGLTSTRFEEVEKDLLHMEVFMLALAQEIRETTAPGLRFSHLWSQVDNALTYTRSLRIALKGEVISQN